MERIEMLNQEEAEFASLMLCITVSETRKTTIREEMVYWIAISQDEDRVMEEGANLSEKMLTEHFADHSPIMEKDRCIYRI